MGGTSASDVRERGIAWCDQDPRWAVPRMACSWVLLTPLQIDCWPDSGRRAANLEVAQSHIDCGFIFEYVRSSNLDLGELNGNHAADTISSILRGISASETEVLRLGRHVKVDPISSRSRSIF